MMLLALLSLMLYHPIFHIQQIQVQGLQRIKESDLIDSVFGALNYKKWFVLPGQSYLLTNVDDIRSMLMEKYPLQSLRVAKIFPQTIILALAERISTIIYDNGRQYSYIGLEGKILEVAQAVSADEWQESAPIVTTTLAGSASQVVTREVLDRKHEPALERVITTLGNYPIVYDTRGQSSEIGQSVLTTATVGGVIEWFNFIEKRTNIPFGYFLITNEAGEGIIKTREGWELRVQLTKDRQRQFDELNLVLREKVNRRDLNYIDLRYPGRIYWK